MQTFRVLDQQLGMVPAAITRTLGEIDVARGREEAFRLQRPQILDSLVDVARIQSTEASNAIERIVAPPQAHRGARRPEDHPAKSFRGGDRRLSSGPRPHP